MKMIIAVDGPAASGKGTIARRIAIHYGLPYLDTGALYRAVARDMLSEGLDLNDVKMAEKIAHEIDPISLDDNSIRSRDVGAAASVIAKHPTVRDALLHYQQNFAANERGAVLDGRDIGTIICPHADVKLYVTASLHERARRRYAELKIKGEKVTEEQIFNEIEARDKRDQTRSTAPLQQAEDSYLLDTTNLDIETAFNTAIRLIEDKIK